MYQTQTKLSITLRVYSLLLMWPGSDGKRSKEISLRDVIAAKIILLFFDAGRIYIMLILKILTAS